MSDGDGSRALQVTVGIRGLAASLALGTLICSWLTRHFSPAAATKRRILKLLDAVAPRVSLSRAGTLLNTHCPVCLNELGTSNGAVRKLACRHGLCATCLERWVIRCVRSHLNPARFSVSSNGTIYSYAPGPTCPLCKAPVPAIPVEDRQRAVYAAALSNFDGQRGVFGSSE